MGMQDIRELFGEGLGQVFNWVFNGERYWNNINLETHGQTQRILKEATIICQAFVNAMNEVSAPQGEPGAESEARKYKLAVKLERYSDGAPLISININRYTPREEKFLEWFSNPDADADQCPVKPMSSYEEITRGRYDIYIPLEHCDGDEPNYLCYAKFIKNPRELAKELYHHFGLDDFTSFNAFRGRVIHYEHNERQSMRARETVSRHQWGRKENELKP